MSSLFSHCWRLLLIAALVLYPVAGAGAAMVSGDAMAAPQAGQADDTGMPPCHMPMHGDAAAKAPAKDAPGEPSHGCDCGNPACQFGACCLVGVFDVPSLRFQPMSYASAQALPDSDVAGTAAPPPDRMIRPPIA